MNMSVSSNDDKTIQLKEFLKNALDFGLYLGFDRDNICLNTTNEIRQNDFLKAHNVGTV